MWEMAIYNESLDKNRKTHWSKVIALSNHLEEYDWLFWLDSDALIMNTDIRLESLIDDQFDLIIARDCNGYVNTGSFLIKNSPWSKEFLVQWYDEKYKNGFGRFQDNGAFIDLYDNSSDIRDHIKVVLPPRVMNSYLGCKYKMDGVYQPGDFILHFAGLRSFHKEDHMKKYSAQIEY